MSNVIEMLNDKQKEAALHTQGPLLILAGAGSGKTRVITNRIAYLIEDCGVNPWNILAITFTNKAAGEMRQRVDDMVGYGSESIWVATFHSTCVRILRRYIDRLGYDTNFTIYDTDDTKAVMKGICKRLKIDTKQMPERAFLSAISHAKDEMMGPSDLKLEAMGNYGSEQVARVYAEYEKELRKSNALDFDDLLLKTVELFKAWPEVLESYQERFKYIMVDEYQDTNTVQFEFIRLLADKYRNICVVGDDDQSIYKFRGANIRNILDFEKVYKDARVVKLEQNYRSTQTILDAANAVISNNKGRKDKSLWTDKGDGPRIHFRQCSSAYEEAEYVVDSIMKGKRDNKYDYRDCAVLYRTNAQARLLEEQLILSGIPYDVVGGVNFYARREIKDILAYLKTIDNARDDIAVKRIINVPRRGIGATTINKVQEYANDHDITFYDALKSAGEIPGLARSAGKLEAFVNLIQVFRSKQPHISLEELVQDVLDTTEYIENLEAENKEDEESRIENIEELINKVVAYEDEHSEEEDSPASLSGFLEEVALVADIDSVNTDSNKVLLMTLHSAKGLEFPHVFLTGLEDGVFPGYMTITSDDPLELEEERRLCYVGITRAMDELTITCARQRMIRGETQYNAPSRFLKEIPQELLDLKVPVGRIRMEDRVDPADEGYTREVFARKPYSSFPGKPRVSAVKPSTPASAKPYIATAGKRAGAVMPPPGKSAQGMISLGKDMGLSGGLDYNVGDTVRHIKFGEGRVLKIEKGARDYEVTVDFAGYGVKKMFAGFAKLKKI
ncbi:MAG: DNA helicase PcrA [Lachnospiraceae bacterium]|nr:DNA helicase PcrA [Lachnospiraceae bacterium]